MRQRIMAILMLAWFSSVALMSAAHAQRAPSATKEELEALKKDLEELRQQTVQIPTLAAAVQDLSARLANLEQHVRTLEAGQKAVPDTIDRLDGLDQKVTALAGDVAAVRTRLGDLEQPWSPSSSGGGVAYQKGFVWTTDDERFAIKLGGYMQGRYELETAEGDVDTSTLRLRRARLGVSGHLGSRKLQYELLLSAIDEPAALDYYMDYAFREDLVLRFGQYKTQFTRNFVTSSRRLDFIERSRAIEGLRYDRDVQVGVHGLLARGRFGYYAGIGNGAGPNTLNDNLDIDMTARADAVILGQRFGYGHGDLGRVRAPSLMIGAGVVHDLVAMPDAIGAIAVNNDVDGDDRIDNARVISASFDAVVRYRGLEAALEAVLRYEEFGTILQHVDNRELVAAIGERDSRTYLGVTGQVTYLLPRNILIGGRVGRSRVPFLGVGGRSSDLPRGEHVFELDGLVQLYNERGYRVLGLLYSVHDYRPLDSSIGDGPREHRLILEGQLVF
jgi:hypothetical protein